MGSTREDRLLLLFTLPAPSPSHLEEAAMLVEEGIDWRLFYKGAQSNRIFPQSFERLSALLSLHPSLPVDKGWLSSMEGAYRQSMGSGMILRAEAKRAMKALAGAGIAFTPFKGILLERTAYPRGVTRDFSDLDLLLADDRERSRAQLLLEGLGYSKLKSGSDAYHIKMTKRRFGTEVSVELHHRLPGITHLYPYPTIEGFWESLRPLDVDGVRMRVMPRGHMLLVVALNAFRDGEIKLKDVSDIAAITASGSVDWEHIKQQMDRLAMGYALKPTLQAYALAMRSLGVPLPAGFPALPRLFKEGDAAGFPVPLSSICENLGCQGLQCRSCPLAMQRELPPLDETDLLNDAFTAFPQRAKVSARLLVTCVRKDYGARYALRCSAAMVEYLSNIVIYMLKLPKDQRKG